MEIQQLRCFVALAETLHFGRAAQDLDMLPASLGRQIKLLEESVGVRLLARTTRNATLTEEGNAFLGEARAIVERADRLRTEFRKHRTKQSAILRIGAIDSASAGLIPQLLPRFREKHGEISVQLLEQKTIRLLPKILSGRLDVAIVRPPDSADSRLEFRPLFFETPVVAVPSEHALSRRKQIKVDDMANEPLIVPDRRSRPHSHDLSIRLFEESGLIARIALIAEEKQTIVSLVSSGIGLAIVPRWASRFGVGGVRFKPLVLPGGHARKELALAACWLGDTRDALRDSFLEVLAEEKPSLAESA